jgi:hypothetical protein
MESDNIMNKHSNSVDGSTLKIPAGGFKIMAVSIKPAPVIKGEAAKKIIDSYRKPTDNSAFLSKCKRESEFFVRSKASYEINNQRHK